MQHIGHIWHEEHTHHIGHIWQKTRLIQWAHMTKNTHITSNTNSKRDMCNTLGTYETKRTHITLDTNDTCNTLLHGIAWYCMVLCGITWYLVFWGIWFISLMNRASAHKSFFHFIRLDLIYSVFMFLLSKCSVSMFSMCVLCNLQIKKMRCSM